jgi:hypothetical protein
MKDPLDTKERPYEVLGVGQNSTMDEINKAWAKLVKDPKARTRRRDINSAWHRIRKAETRVEDDIWSYSIHSSESAVAVPGEVSAWVMTADPILPDLSLGIEVTDLGTGRYRQDFRPMEFREIRLSHIEHYDPAGVPYLAVTFDT